MYKGGGTLHLGSSWSESHICLEKLGRFPRGCPCRNRVALFHPNEGAGWKLHRILSQPPSFDFAVPFYTTIHSASSASLVPRGLSAENVWRTSCQTLKKSFLFPHPHKYYPLSTPLSRPLVVGGSRLAVVADQLEPADHLPHGEEAEALRGDDAASNQLSPRDVAGLLQYRGGLRCGLGCCPLGTLEQGGGVTQLLPSVLEVCLEGGGGANKRGGNECQ